MIVRSAVKRSARVSCCIDLHARFKFFWRSCPRAKQLARESPGAQGRVCPRELKSHALLPCFTRLPSHNNSFKPNPLRGFGAPGKNLA